AGAAGIVGVMVAKRLAGNRPPDRRTAGTYLHRLLFDRDPDGPGGPAEGERADGGTATAAPGAGTDGAPASPARAGADPDGRAPAGEGRTGAATALGSPSSPTAGPRCPPR